jgi:hypothetical protein
MFRFRQLHNRDRKYATPEIPFRAELKTNLRAPRRRNSFPDFEDDAPIVTNKTRVWGTIRFLKNHLLIIT